MGDEEVKYVKARGLPWSASADEVLEFFNNCQVVGGSAGVHFINNYDGRPSGTCYLELSSAEDVTKALARDKDKMGKRYIEVFEASAAELEADLNRRPGGGDDGRGGDVGEDAVVKLRGLPFSASKVDIADFFAGLEIESNGILVVTDYEGRPKGEAYVQFTTTAGAERALEKNKQNMGHRYIEVFTSSMEEAKRAQVQMAFGAMGGGGGRGGGAGGPMRGGMMGPGAMMRPGPYDRMGGYGMGGGPPRGGGGYLGGGMRGGYFSGGGVMGMRGGGLGGMGMHGGMYVVKMRGLPFRATEQDICEWFSSVCDPIDVFIRFNQEGRPSGEAEVTFATEGEAKRALSKNKQNMQNRYIELFLEQY